MSVASDKTPLVYAIEADGSSDNSSAAAVSGNDIGNDIGSNIVESVSGNSVSGGDGIPDSIGGEIVGSEAVEIKVPIYSYDIVDVVVPTSYAVALNPYEMAVRTGENEFSTEQVVSRNYGIVNKSTRDKIVTVTLWVKDQNQGQIIFVNSEEEAQNADKDVYAVYLGLIPAADGDIRVNGELLDKNTSAEAVADVEMNKADEKAVTLHEGENKISFLLSKAEYGYGEEREGSLEAAEDDEKRAGADAGGNDISPGGNIADIWELKNLAEDGSGATAFTFGGTMNPNADWGKLINGINISVVYTYEDTDGSETFVEGTGAVIERQ